MISDTDKNKLKVLVVDDEKEIVDFISNLLDKEGYEVLKAYSAADFHAIINKVIPDILILNVLLPDGDGIEICKQLRANPDTRNVCVLLLSEAKVTDEDRLKALEQYADDYIIKPLKSEEFLTRMRVYARLKLPEIILKAEEDKYRLLFESNPLPMWVYDKESLSFLNVNKAAVVLYGYTDKEYNVMSIKDIFCKDEAREFLVVAGHLKSGLTDAGVWRHKKKDGSVIYVEIYSQGIVYEGRLAMLVSGNDVTRRIRLEKLMLIEKDVLELGAREVSLEDTLSLLIKKMEELSGEVLCSILFVDEDEVTIRTGPAPSLPEEYNKIIDGIHIDPEVEPFGTVVERRQRVIVTEIETDPLWRNYKDVALKFGLKAYWAYPIFSADNKISGTFACYYKYVKEPGKEDTELVERAAVIAGILMDKDKAIKMLRKSDMQLKEINESLPAAVYQVKIEDTQPEFLFISEGVKELYGLTPREVYESSRKLTDRIHPDDLSLYKACIMNSALYLKKEWCDYRLKAAKDHSYKWIRDTFIPVKRNGSIIWNGTLTDITDIKNAQEAIERQEEWYKALIENNSDVVLVVDEIGTIVYASPSSERVTGFSPQELKDHKLMEFIHSEDVEEAGHILKKVVEKHGNSLAFQHRMTTREGTPFYVEGIVTNLLQDPNIHGIVSNFRDVTERVLAREQLIKSQRELIEAQKIARVWSYELDPGKSVLKASGEFFRFIDISGITKLDLKEFSKFIHPEDRIAVFKKLNNCIRTGSKFILDYRIILASGTVLYISATGKAKLDNDGNVEKVFGTMQDITDRKRTEKILLAERTVLELAAKELTLNQTLTLLIRNLEEISGDMLGSILFLNEDGKTITTGPSPSLPKEYCKKIDGIEIQPEVEPFGTAVFRMKPVIVSDIENDVLWKDFKHLALKHGLKSYWAFPIILPDKKAVGTFASYYKYKKEPSNKDIDLLNRAVKIAGVLIERDMTTKSLRKSQKLLHELSTSIPGVFFQYMRSTGGHYSILFMSDGVEKIYGLKPEKVYKNPGLLTDKIHPDDIEVRNRAIKKSAETLQPWLYEYRVFQAGNKTYRWIRSNAVPQQKEDGSIVWNGTLTDVTDIKLAEENIRQSEERYRSLFDKNPLSMFIVEKDSLNFMEVNNATVNHFGYTYRELRSMKLTDIIQPDDIKKLKKKLKEVKEGADVEFVIRNITKNKEVLYMNVLVTEIVYKGKAAFLKIATDITDRVNYEKTIELQNIYFKELFNASPFGIVMFNQDNKIINVNKGFEELFQFTMDEVQGKSVKETIVPPEHYQEAEKILSRTKEEIIQHETKRKRKDGSLVDVMVVRYPIINNEKVIGYYGIYVDISERKKWEETLRDNEERFRLIIDTALDAVIELDAAGMVTGWNRQAEITFGWTREETLGQLLRNLIIPPRYRKAHQEGIERFLETGEGPLLNRRIEVSAMHRKGYEFPVELSIAPVKRKGKFYFSAFVRDISERVRIMDELERSLALSRATLESTADGILVVDWEGKISGYNQRFMEMWKIPYSIIETKDDQRAIAFAIDQLKYPEEFLSKVKELYASPELESFDILELKDGRTFERYSKPQTIPGKIIGRVWSFRDVTERNRNIKELLTKNKELVKANEELDRFVYSTSHDLRAPLTSVLGLITIAEMDKDETKRKVYLEKMKNSIKRLDAFIQDIVHYSRNLRLEVRNEKIEIKKLVSELVESLRFMTSGSERIKFNVEIDEKKPFVSDKARISVLFNNLISNAIKYHNYNQDNPYINIKVNVTKEYTDIIIEDNGQGIPKDQQKKVFEMFYRASEKSTGSGLGLYIVQEIVSKLQGTIKLESEPGVGTTFFVKIPNHVI